MRDGLLRKPQRCEEAAVVVGWGGWGWGAAWTSLDLRVALGSQLIQPLQAPTWNPLTNGELTSRRATHRGHLSKSELPNPS